MFEKKVQIKGKIDHTVSGEIGFKPVEEMTDEEIRQELQELETRSRGIDDCHRN